MQSLRIAFLAGNKNPALFLNDASFRYRCENLALMLREQGHEVTLCHYRHFKPQNKHYDIIVFHRPSDNWYFRRALSRCHKTGAQLIADVDDLIIHPKWASFSPGVMNNLINLKKIQIQYKKNYLALSQFTKFTTSTTPLMEKMIQLFNGEVKVIANAPHQNWKNSSRLNSQVEQPLITYFPGTASHDRDFATIEEPLKDFLSDHPNVTLAITGVLGGEIGIRPTQLKLAEKQPFDVYASKVSESWVNLSPLETTPFNECKSALKTLEAAFWGKPTITSINPDNLRYEGNGAIIAENKDDWFKQLNNLMNSNIYNKYVYGLPEKANRLASPENLVTQFLTLGCDN
ncbi:MAG: hypothetical protein HWE39_24660 [Oceanospirillaceae bacterium]|nr:hypothetical protein [Oceanospirillaceae bacterium]